MPKISIIRKGAKRPVLMPARTAHRLAKTRNWNYVEETVSKPKRTAQGKHAAGSAEAFPVKQKAVAEKEDAKAGPKAVKPMLASVVRPTRQPVPSSREQLEGMTKADLKALANRFGVDLKATESKDEWVRKLNRYLRRDMRAER